MNDTNSEAYLKAKAAFDARCAALQGKIDALKMQRDKQVAEWKTYAPTYRKQIAEVKQGLAALEVKQKEVYDFTLSCLRATTSNEQSTIDAEQDKGKTNSVSSAAHYLANRWGLDE